MKNRSCRDRMDIILNNYNYEHNMRVDYKFGIGACNTVIKYHNTKKCGRDQDHNRPHRCARFAQRRDDIAF